MVEGIKGEGRRFYIKLGVKWELYYFNQKCRQRNYLTNDVKIVVY